MTHEWIGLRDEDLTDRERALLDDGPRDDHDAAIALGQELTALGEGPAPPSADAALARLKARQPPPLSRWWVAPVALAASALLAVGVYQSGGRDKGAAAPPALHLEAAAEGPDGVRALRDGASVRADERVLFRVDAEGDGWIALTDEAGGTLMTARGSGKHVVGGATPQSYRPDVPLSEGTYRAVQCASGPPTGDTPGPDCAASAITLTWE